MHTPCGGVGGGGSKKTTLLYPRVLQSGEKNFLQSFNLNERLGKILIMDTLV